MSHRRYNPLLNEWVLVAKNRIKRPWQGDGSSSKAAITSNSSNTSTATIVANNPLAPGGQRANNRLTPMYSCTFVFQNDFPSLTDQSSESPTNDELFRIEQAKGTCR